MELEVNYQISKRHKLGNQEIITRVSRGENSVRIVAIRVAHTEAKQLLGLIQEGGDYYLDYLFDNGEVMRSDYAISGLHPEDSVTIMADHVKITVMQGPGAGNSLCVDPKQLKIWTADSDVAIHIKDLSDVNQLHINAHHAYSAMVGLNGKPANKEDYKILVKGEVPGNRLRSTAPLGFPILYHSCEVTEACRTCYFRPMVLLCSGHKLIELDEMTTLMGEHLNGNQA